MRPKRAGDLSLIWTVLAIILILIYGCGGESKDKKKTETSKSEVETKSAPVTQEGSATIVGAVKYAGMLPTPKELDVTARDKEVCAKEGKTKTSEDLVVDVATKGVKNAVVSITASLDPKYSYKSPPILAKNPELDQRGCWFYPHVQVVPMGVSIDIFNNDGILHNIHTYSIKNPVMNTAQPKYKKKIYAKFDIAEIISVKCDVHNWMSAWLVVSEHPYYAVSDEKGNFKLENVPAGSYQLQCWHETLGTEIQEVTVPETGQVVADFEFKPK
jgi:hypothetical protein